MSIEIVEHSDKRGGSFHVIDTTVSSDENEACIGFFDTEYEAEMFVSSLPACPKQLCAFGCDENTPIWDRCVECTEQEEDKYCARCTVAMHQLDDIYCSYCRLYLAQESRMIDSFIAMKSDIRTHFTLPSINDELIAMRIKG